VIVELEGRAEWHYPCLCFLARLLESDPEVSQMIFTEARAGEGGSFVCMCSPLEFRKRTITKRELSDQEPWAFGAVDPRTQ
jgi:hypothetical protein